MLGGRERQIQGNRASDKIRENLTVTGIIEVNWEEPNCYLIFETKVSTPKSYYLKCSGRLPHLIAVCSA